MVKLGQPRRIIYDTHKELSELVSIYESGVFREFLTTRKQFLQSEVNKFVRQKDVTEAFGALSKLEDLDKIMGMLSKRISELREE